MGKLIRKEISLHCLLLRTPPSLKHQIVVTTLHRLEAFSLRFLNLPLVQFVEFLHQLINLLFQPPIFRQTRDAVDLGGILGRSIQGTFVDSELLENAFVLLLDLLELLFLLREDPLLEFLFLLQVVDLLLLKSLVEGALVSSNQMREGFLGVHLRLLNCHFNLLENLTGNLHYFEALMGVLDQHLLPHHLLLRNLHHFFHLDFQDSFVEAFQRDELLLRNDFLQVLVDDLGLFHNLLDVPLDGPFHNHVFIEHFTHWDFLQHDFVAERLQNRLRQDSLFK